MNDGLGSRRLHRRRRRGGGDGGSRQAGVCFAMKRNESGVFEIRWLYSPPSRRRRRRRRRAGC